MTTQPLRPLPPPRPARTPWRWAPLLLLAACGPSPAPPTGPRPVILPDGGTTTTTAAGPTAEPGRCPPPPDDPAIPRAEVRAVVDAGPAELLARLRTDPVLDRPGPGARFVGFRLLALDPDFRCGALGLREGDVVTAVNGFAVERPEALLELLAALESADRITVSLLRGGLPVEVSARIEDAPVSVGNGGVSAP